MQRTKWVDRKFTFDHPTGWLPDIIERLRGTEPRLRAMTASLSEEALARKPDGSWSIKEHIGHLGDLEALHEGRIDELEARKDALQPADMTNARTNEAHHNEQPLEQLHERFATLRNHLIMRLEQLDDSTQEWAAMHPRLGVRMRPIDVAYFTAEHDDHHLATIRSLITG
jgi:DinB family protein